MLAEMYKSATFPVKYEHIAFPVAICISRLLLMAQQREAESAKRVDLMLTLTACIPSECLSGCRDQRSNEGV